MAKKKQLVPKGQELDAIHELLEAEYWLPTLEGEVTYRVQTDDNDGKPDVGWLFVCIAMDSDVHVQTLGGDDCRFRSFFGGGNHSRVRKALMILAEAIRFEQSEQSE